MSDMQRLGRCSGIGFEGRWIAPPSLPVREPAQVLDGGEDRSAEERRIKTRTEARPQWPFLYSYQGDTVIVNKAPHKSKYQNATEIGQALL
jgi:hypothetical protein